jgi:hypothetical protein
MIPGQRQKWSLKHSNVETIHIAENEVEIGFLFTYLPSENHITE